MANRLANSTSPYLLAHAANPVDWWEEAAFEEARRRNLPVLLSVGYAACHWCHVMAHESFEDEATAAYLNKHFVSIKIDREERPDVDAVYMNATQAITGHGGWPMTCVLDHDRVPFFAGTYFPDGPRQGSPSFRQVLEALSDAWRNRGDDVGQTAEEIRRHLQAPGALPAGALGRDALARAVGTLAREFDPANAGFGGAPKFPPSMALEFLLRNHARTSNPLSKQMLDATCVAMARGGLYDQLVRSALATTPAGSLVQTISTAFLFSGTVADNIRFGRPEAARDEVETAARAVGADTVIEGLPAGFDTEVGERGALLSAGERQLIAFARAWIADPALLVLDEATSHLDVVTELRVTEAVRRLRQRQGRTTIVIAHRLSTVAEAGQVAVVEDGCVVEAGPPDDLRRRHGPFADLHHRWLAVAT